MILRKINLSVRYAIIASFFVIIFTPQVFADEEWIKPTRDVTEIYFGILEYDEIPAGFECEVSPKISHHIVSRQASVDVPEYDSMVLRLGGEKSAKDLEMEVSLWYGDTTSAEDLSYDISLVTESGTKIGGAVYSPDSYSVYSTLGVAIEANSNTTNGVLPHEARQRLGTIFNGTTYTSYGAPEDGAYNLYVRVFDSDNDWTDSDRCGIQAIVPFSVSNNQISIETIRFSNIKVSALETEYGNYDFAQKVIADAVKNNMSSTSLDMKYERPDNTSLKWLENSYSSTDMGIIRVVDHYMNQDSEKAENLSVYVYTEETEYEDSLTITAIETGLDTGMFEAKVIFSETDDPSDNMLRVSDGDIVAAEYMYTTIPGSYYIENVIGIGQEITIQNPIPSPLKQIHLGILADSVQCRDSLEFILKHDGDPACVTLETKQKLLDRGGWHAQTLSQIESADEKIMQTKTTGHVSLDREAYPIPFGVPQDFASKMYENSTTPDGRSIFPIHHTGINGEGIPNNTLGIDSGEFIASGDLVVHVQITDPDLNSSKKIDSISNDVDKNGIPVGPVKISVMRNSENVVLAYAGGRTTNISGLIDAGGNNPETTRRLGPIYETANNSGVFAFELPIRYTDGPAHEKCPRTTMYSGLTDATLDGFLYDQEDRFDESSRNPYCIMNGDVLKIEYTDATDASGNVNIVTDSSVFAIQNAELESDRDVYIIGSDVTFTLTEHDLNLDSQRIEEYDLDLIEWDSNAATIAIGDADGQIASFDPEPVIFRETGNDTGIFRAVLVVPSEIAGKPLERGEEVVLKYTDWSPSGADFVGQEDEDVNLTIYISLFGATVNLDKKNYTLGDTVHVTIVSPNHNLDSDLPETLGDTVPYTVKIMTKDFVLENYKLFETGNDTGIFTGEVTLLGTDTGKTTQGKGPKDGMIQASSDDGITIYFEFSEDETVVGSALIQ